MLPTTLHFGLSKLFNLLTLHGKQTTTSPPYERQRSTPASFTTTTTHWCSGSTPSALWRPSRSSYTWKLCYFDIQSNSFITNSVVNEHSVITNRFLGQIGHFTTQINTVITNKNGKSQAVRYNRISLYIVLYFFCAHLLFVFVVVQGRCWFVLATQSTCHFVYNKNIKIN